MIKDFLTNKPIKYKQECWAIPIIPHFDYLSMVVLTLPLKCVYNGHTLVFQEPLKVKPIIESLIGVSIDEFLDRLLCCHSVKTNMSETNISHLNNTPYIYSNKVGVIVISQKTKDFLSQYKAPILKGAANHYYSYIDILYNYNSDKVCSYDRANILDRIETKEDFIKVCPYIESHNILLDFYLKNISTTFKEFEMLYNLNEFVQLTSRNYLPTHRESITEDPKLVNLLNDFINRS